MSDGELETAQTSALVFPEPGEFFFDVHQTLVELPWILLVGDDEVVLLFPVGVALDDCRAAFCGELVRNQANYYADGNGESADWSPNCLWTWNAWPPTKIMRV